PLTNFALPENQEKMRAALREQRKQFARKVPLTINGEKIWTDNMFSSVNPSQPDQIVGYAAEAGVPEAERAVAAARMAFEKSRRTGHRAVEFSDGDLVWHGQRRARHGEHGDHETVRAIGHHRCHADGNLRRSRRAAWRIEFSQWQRLGDRCAHG